MVSRQCSIGFEVWVTSNSPRRRAYSGIPPLSTINTICGAIADAVFALLSPLGPVGALLVISLLTGVAMLVVYRLASNQAGLRRVRNDITANLLAVRLYRDEMSVVFRAQARLLWATARMLGYQVKPFCVMVAPMVLALAQVAMWYQYRPLQPGDQFLVTVLLKPNQESRLTELSLTLPASVSPQTPPLRIAPYASDHGAAPNGEFTQRLRAESGADASIRVEPALLPPLELSIGGDFRRIRPSAGGSFWRQLLFPGGPVPPPSSPVLSAAVTYPLRQVHVPVLSTVFGWVGLDHWLVHYLVLAMLAAFLLKPLVGVQF